MQLAERCRAYFSYPVAQPLLVRHVALVCSALLSDVASYCICLFIGCGRLLLIAWLVLELHARRLNPLSLKIIKSYDGAVIFCLFLKSCFL